MGGSVFTDKLSEENLKNIAINESIKTSLVDLPFGGGFGGVMVDQNKITKKDLERISKLYSQFLFNHVGAWKDILLADIETNAWMMDAYEKKKKFHSPATFTTNKHNLDGSVFILREYLKISNLNSRFRKLDVAICGFGNRANTFLSNLNSQDFRVVAISDSTGGIVNSKGFDFEEIKKLKDKFTSLKEVSTMCSKEFITNEELLKLPVDIIVLATNFEIEIQIKSETLPSILLNSGFSALSHLDWVQKMHGYKWGREEVLRKLELKMTKTFGEVKAIVDEKKISYKEASYYLGVKRIIDAMMERGRV